MLSFPRDLLVPIQCPHKPTYTGRINEAVSYCGTQGALETVKGLTGLPINYLVTVNFVGFVKLVAELGGVWMDVDQRYFNRRAPATRRSTCTPATRSSTAGRRSTSSATGTPTRTSTGSRGSSSSSTLSSSSSPARSRSGSS